MEEIMRYTAFVGLTLKQNVMDSINLFQHGSSWPVNLYFCLVHLLLLSLVLYIFLYSRKKSRDGSHQRGRARTFKRGNRDVTSETCEWLNSAVAWYYLHSSAKNTPDLVKTWIRNMNRALYKNRTNNQRIFITNVCSDCLPPKLTSVYCLHVDGTMQCITFHVESRDLGFHVHINQPSSNGTSTNVILEVSVLRLSGEVALQLNSSPLEAKIMFIGEPEIQLFTRAITKDGIDGEAAAAVEEKLKEVICKTVTSVPLVDSNTKPESESNNAGFKDKLDSPILQTCVGEEGKLLVKVVKATGLCSKDKSANISPYCILSVDNPYQRKRTSLLKDTDSPFWNDYFPFDITAKTREITLNIFDFEKTPADVNYHMEDNELSVEQDDFLGQVIVPLATVNRNQTCRLILPILPKTNKCDYVKGELSLEFTFDKDGKVIDRSLPLVDVTENKSKATAVEETVYDVTVDKVDAAKCVNDGPAEYFSKGFGGAYAYSLDKSYMETSLDELAQEIESYETQPTSEQKSSEEKSVEVLMEMKPVEEEPENRQRKRESLEMQEELAVLEATLSERAIKRDEDTENSKPEQVQEPEPEPEPAATPTPTLKTTPEPTPEPEPTPKATPEPTESTPVPTPEPETESKEEKSEAKLKGKRSLTAKLRRRPKSTVDADKKADKEADKSRHSYHAGDQPEKEDEAVPEAAAEAEAKESEEKAEGEEEGPSDISKEPKSKMRRSLKLKLKKGKKEDKEKADKEVSLTQETEPNEPEVPDESKELESLEESLKTDPPKSRFGRFRRSKEYKEPKTDELAEDKKEDESADQKPQQSKSKFGRLRRSKDKKEVGKADEEDKEEEKEPQAIDEGDEKKELETIEETAEKKDPETVAEAEKKEAEIIAEAEKKEAEIVAEPEKKEPEIVAEPEKKEPETVEENPEEIKPKIVAENVEKQEQEVVPESAVQEEPMTTAESTEKKELETVHEDAEPGPSEKPADQPKTKFRMPKLKRANKRPVSMSAADMKATQEDERKPDSTDPVRHSYHAGDLPEPAPLQRRSSETSLLSYSPNPFSSLVIEMEKDGEKVYYHIPVSMARRGTYEQKGPKYHVYNEHMFRAVHFDSSTNCAVCSSSISGIFGKQGYQCKDCKLATHKKCHFQTSDICSNSSIKTIKLITAPTIVGN